MNINIFEGMRRIVRIIAVLSVFGYCLGVWINKPYVKREFIVFDYSKPPEKVSKYECSSDDRSVYKYFYLSNGTVGIDICFRSYRHPKTGQYLVPYTLAGDTSHVWMADNFSSEIDRYTSDVLKRFTLTTEDVDAANNELFTKKVDEAIDYFPVFIGWLISLFAVSKVIGWVVRGFLGIPVGMDFKP